MTGEREPYDAPVLILGNGPVGQTAALLLARWGIASVVVDSRPERDCVGSKAICQHRDVLDVWDAVGAGRRIAGEGVTWTTARTFYRDRELFTVTFPDRGQSAFPPFVNISQSRTEQLLDERIAATPLVEQRWGHEAVRLTQDSTGVTVSCRTPDGEYDLRAAYALACGGAQTELRRLLGVTFDGHSFDDQFLICDIRTKIPGWETERRFFFDPEWNPGRQVLIHPTPGGTYRIDWQVPPDYDLAAEEASGALDARIRKIVGAADYEIVWKSVYRFHQRAADRFVVGRVLLVGDCAHLMAPFGARGLNSGVQDAENAAWKLAFVLRGWAPEALVATYHDERHAAATENLDVTSATMAFLVPQDESGRAHRRDVLERALTDPAARSEVDSGRLSEPFWYVDSPLTTPDPTRPFPGRPARGEAPPVVPGVLVPDLPVRDPSRPEVSRLREIVRDGLLVLTTEGSDVRAVDRAVRETTGAPMRVVPLAGLEAPDLPAALQARPGEAWLVRPDGHVAAVVPDADPGLLRAASLRLLAAHSTG